MKLLDILVFCVVVITANASPTNDSMSDILNQLEAGENVIKLDNRYKDTVLILGVTGTGKSTLVQFIAGDNSKLIATETAGKKFVIEDTNERISDSESSTISKTEFPELVIENVTNTAFYDCPGFSDTRSAAKDIGTTYFIKKVTEFSHRVKLVFVVSFHAVEIGRDRSAFVDLLRHITSLVNDVDLFNNSLALIVTKVDNSYRKRGRDLVLTSDDDVINGIAQFLNGTRRALTDDKNEKFGLKAAKIVNIMLDKENGTYTRIGIFRTPDEEGPLDKIELLQDGKQNLNRIIHDNLKFVETQPDTFGYTISADSKVSLLKVIDELHDYIDLVFGKIAADINRHYERLATDKPSEVGEILWLGFKTFSMFLANITVETTGPESIRALLNSVNTAQINLPVTQLNEIQKKFNFVFFLEQVSGLQFKTSPLQWIDVFRSINSNIKTSVEHMQRTIASRLSFLILKHTMSIKSYFSIEGKDETSFLDKAIQSFPVLAALMSNCRALRPNPLTIAFLGFFSDSRIAGMNENTSDLESHLNDTIALDAFGLHATDQALITEVTTSLLESKSKLESELNDYITIGLNMSAAYINRHYQIVVQGKPSAVGKELELGYKTFFDFLNSISVETTGLESINSLVKSIQLAGINIAQTGIDDLQKKFKALEQVSGLQFKPRPLEWTTVFRSISRNIETSVEHMQRTIANRLSYLILKHTMSIKSYFSLEAKDGTSFLDKAIRSFPVLNTLVSNCRETLPNSITIAFLDFFKDSRVADMDDDSSDLESHLNDTIALDAFGLQATDQALITEVTTLLLETKSKLESELDDYITEGLNMSAAHINRHYQIVGQGKPSTVGKELELGYKTFFDFLNNISFKTTGLESINSLVKTMELAGINIAPTEIDDIRKKFKALEQVSGLQLKPRPLEWIDVFRPISRNIKTSVEHMQRTIDSRLGYLILKHTMSIKSYFSSEAKDDTSFLDKAIKGFPVLSSLVSNLQAQSPNSLTIAFLDFFTDSRIADLHEATSDLESNLNDTIALQAFGLRAADETLITKVKSILLESKSELMSKLKVIANKINTVTKQLSSTISAEINEKFIIINDKMRLDDKLEVLKKRQAFLDRSLKENDATNMDASDFIYLCHKIGLNIYSSDIELKYESYCDALTSITNIPIKFDLNYKLFSPALFYLKSHVIWYSYLEKLSNALNSKTVQTRRNTYNLDSLRQVASFTGFNSRIKLFDNLVSSSTLTSFQPTEKNRNELTNLITLTLSDAKISCPGNGQLLVTGNNIRMSEVVIANCPYKFDTITVFAFNAIFLDSHYTNEGNIQMSIISPQFNVVDRAIINLSGSRARPLVQTGSAPDQVGQPGFPGSQGGALFALASVYNNAHLLTVNVNGGNGGDGQNGGDGRAGDNGDDARMPYSRSDSCDEKQVVSDFSLTYTRRQHRGDVRATQYYFTVHGRNAQIGGRGKDGGKGGEGGYSGQVKFVELNSINAVDKVVINRAKGKVGLGGLGGQGGKGGRNGDSLNVICWGAIYFIFKTNGHRWSEEKRYSNGIASDGSKGKDNYNSANQIGATNKVRKLRVDEIVNQYIESYFKQLDDGKHLFDKLALEFVNDLNTNHKVTHSYNILGYIEQFKIVNHKVKGQPLERRLIQTNYMNNLVDYSLRADNSDKVLVNYLYLAMYTNYMNDKEQFGSNMVVNMMGYFELIKQNIAKTTQLLKSNVIHNLNGNYQNKIDSKINEAQALIETEVISEINAISEKIDLNIGSLLSEIEELKVTAVEDKKQLIIKQDELRQQLKMKATFGILKIFAAATAFIPKVGIIISGAISSGISVAESMMIKDISQPRRRLQLPEGVRNSISQLTNNVNRVFSIETKVNKANNLLRLLEGLPELGNFVDGVVKLKVKLSKTTEIKEIKELDKELDTALDKTIKQAKKKESIDALGMFKTSLKVAQTIGSTFGEIQKGIGQIEELDNAIKTAQADFDDLGSYKKVVDDMIAPMLQQMTGDMSTLITDLKSKNQVSLDIAKWKVNEFLNNMKKQIQQFTKGFQAEAEFTELIVKLTHAIDVTITIYGRIETYKDQQKLADYIANVNSPLAANMNEHSKQITELELDIMSKVMREQYNRALSSFKLWVFPFANLYAIDQQTDQRIEVSRGQMIADAISRIDRLNAQLIEYKTTIVKKHDKNLFFKTYSSELVSSNPFYSWSNHSSRRIIAKFITGQKVTVLADVKKSQHNEDAVKFNLIKLSLNTDKTEEQSKLENILKNCEISMTHMGHSQYRYNRKYYTISHDTQTITYSLETDSNGQPITANSVYQKLKSGDIMLSPYATWTFKLNCLIHRNYLELKHFRDHLRLELNGEGSFVRSTSLDMDEHYTAI